MNNSNIKICLIIMDGWGYSEKWHGNAVYHAKTPNFDALWKKYPHGLLHAGEKFVGLPKGQVGTSEVNHMTIGAGRVIYQELLRINRDFKNKSVNKNKVILKTFDHVKSKKGSVLHLMGLLSDGGVHSHIKHFIYMLRLAKSHHVKKTIIHVFTDGRDTPPQSAQKYIDELYEEINKLQYGEIGSISGRYYAMDRDNNWERTDLYYKVITNPPKSTDSLKTYSEVIANSYKKGVTDEFIKPRLLQTKNRNYVKDNDGLIFINFRSDRAKQITKRFLSDKRLENLFFASMSQYGEGLKTHVIFKPHKIRQSLGEILDKNNLKQLRVAETEKYNHVTYFFNCKRNQAFEKEDRILLDSNSHVATHDELPEMRARDISKEIVQAMKSSSHEFILVNFANPDMVGHSGKLEPTIKACEVVDEALGEIYEQSKKSNYILIITADHGNAEELIDEKTGEPKTSHTLNPVPIIITVKNQKSLIIKSNDHIGSLIDIAPTILKLFKIPAPEIMKGESLL